MSKTGKVYGYVRVSSREQNIARQIIALEHFGVMKNNIFIDKQSGKDFNRPAYEKMKKSLRAGDLIVVKSIDRLGRNYDEILKQWRNITKIIRAEIIVLDMPVLDTRTKNNDLTGTFIADIVLQILSYVAQTEREFIKRRQAEGIEAAKAKGVRFGRKKLELPEKFQETCEKCKEGNLSIRDAAKLLSLSATTFYRRYTEQYNKG